MNETPGAEFGVSDLGTFELDHLQPVKLILFQKLSIILTFILGRPILYYPREWKRGSSRGWKWEKGFTQKLMRHRGF